MSKFGIILIIIFLVFLYLYTFIKMKRKRNQKNDAVTAYRKTYLEHHNKNKIENEKKKLQDNNGYTYYVTKYNSTVDYLEKETNTDVKK